MTQCHVSFFLPLKPPVFILRKHSKGLSKSLTSQFIKGKNQFPNHRELIARDLIVAKEILISKETRLLTQDTYCQGVKLTVYINATNWFKHVRGTLVTVHTLCCVIFTFNQLKTCVYLNLGSYHNIMI